MWKFIVLIVSALLNVKGQILQNGQCPPSVNLEIFFRIDDFLGTWYEIRNSETTWSGDCATFEFTASTGTNNYTAYYRSVNQNFLQEQFGSASVEANAQISLSLPQVSSQPINFWVQLTNYFNFALVYGCENVGDAQRHVYYWQLSRENNFNAFPNVPAAFNVTMGNTAGIQQSDLREVNHGNDACLLLPPLQAGDPIILAGSCDQSITGLENFNVGDFLGVWHEVNSYYSDNVFGTCGRAQYSDGGSVVNIVNSQINSSSLLTIEGFASLIGTDGRARLNVTLEVLPGVFSNSELFVLGTDYDQWAVSYACVDLPNNNKQLFSWIVSRTRVLPEWARSEVDQVINSFVELNRQYYQTTDQSEEGCFYAPEPQLEGPVVFGGQCAQDVIGIPDFNAALYLGPWYEIEAYPSLNQTGACVKAEYSLSSDGVINVVNTQVVDQSLEAATATAVPVNGSQLLVTFNIPGTNASFDVDYVVLATDYFNYALVYSCTNINDYQQRVVVWKLSRTKELGIDSNSAINNATSDSLPVVQEQYFQETDQGPEACFYLPEPNGEVVRVPGQCGQFNISVEQGFNLTAFSGLWYEVEAFPKDQQQGDCINHQFDIVSNSQLSIESSSVVDHLSSVSFGSLTSVSLISEGRFILSVQTSNGTISFPYDIIATDYEDYALAYSCANDGDEFMNVYSWKLSRTPQLTPSAVTNIVNAISNVLIIDERYFEPVPQDDNACFTFPVDLVQGSPVVLDGQCGDVQPLQNFNAADYLGRWHLIDTYPSDNQGGSCSTQELKLINSTVEVTNSQIVNQTVFTDIGIATLANFSTALLEVQFPNAPSPFQLYVLVTDYFSYSLVYGCVNLNTETYRVYSWKLSRTRTLDQEDFNAIQTTVDSIPVLNNRYYVRVDQSTEGCFYYPPVGEPFVVFPGRCDESIQVVDDFNVGDYLGLWHDLRSYPLPFQMGSCPNARYSLGANGVDVFNTQVINQALDTIDGLAVLTNATSTEGKLTVSFPSLGTSTSKYWVLATDYFDFAIVYSCENMVNVNGDDEQQISSWVLSRTKSLSVNASTAYLNALDTVRVLDDRYYIKRDQSDEGCFYYPTPEPGKPVVFNGPCSDNIPVVPNLNLTGFSGLWHEIESYPKIQQTGDCIRHEFSVQDDSLGLQSFNVIAESLGVTDGVVTRNDSSGRLTINFNTNGISYEIDYWIVDTDYKNYALVYSCENYDDNTRGVFSWKLSRSKELSNTSTEAIASALLDIDVLQEQYYEPIDQTDEACFHYPDLAPGEHVIFPGRCANISAVSNFNASRYLGTWKLIEAYPSNFQNGACAEAKYSLGSDGTVVVYNTEVIDQTLQVDVGSAVLVDADIGLFVVNFPNSTQSQELLVLDTDYETYSFVYACTNVGSDERRVFSWKLSRTNTLDGNANTAINAVLNSTDVLDQRYFVLTDRSAQACFYYPEATGAPVRFRALCDPNIQVVTGFDPVAYEGLWYDVGSYPTPDQGGQCSNAHYTVGPNGVDVFNTQVVNQTLDTISGTAVLADPTSTEAKLLVNFPSQGTSLSDYWVLATDYESYALVYSCFNYDDEYSYVFSWKLSRTKSLSMNATTEINNAINRVQVLADQYYVEKDQSDDACFYFPEPQPGVSVRFPGTCEADLPVTPNFSLSRFEGTWYEIQTYPKEQQTGQCISHEFTVSGNSIDLISKNVFNGIPGVTNGTANFVTPDETSGRFVITIQSNGVSIEIPYWIIDTDYDNYALAYSCIGVVNERGLDERAVFSWKLSRNQILSGTSNQAINNAAANIDVIDNRYFEEVAQDEDACFYVPDLNPGDSIIFTGQCGNVQGVDNFNAGEYLGTWNLIEHYASSFQLGTCADATYSLSPDGSVEVVNTEVINQTLSTMIGRAVLVQGSSGVLSVTFPNAPPIEYVVLATDYDSYSLVYACQNINPTQRRVYSWKLSKTDSLSPTAITAIDEVINNTNVLVQRFYQVVDRTYEDCFYFPEPSDNPVEFRGSCDPNVAVVENFDAGRYLGKWNLIENYPSQFQLGTCATAEYSQGTVEGTVIAVNQEVVDQTLMTDIGTATVIGNGKLSVLFPNAPSPIEYWVLDTDYDNYALVYSCENRDNGRRRRVNSWKLSRTNELRNVASIEETINRVEVLDQRYYKTVDRSYEGCFYYPEVTGKPVEFRGQCDPSVAVVENFDAGRYLGKWNLIENYPSEFQLGTCATAEYSLGTVEGTVIAVNQEVVDQTLMTDIGTATVIGNGKLSVLFPNAPTPIEYWVLDTDYDSYAIVYSCVDFKEKKKVYSWKLSRENSLSPSSINSINSVMNRVNVLDQRYYEAVDRSDTGCFYYPEPSDNPVILRGSCDSNVAVVEDFDIARYEGTWYQIERYPQTFEDTNSTCAGTRYAFNQNEGVVNVINWEVRNGTLYSLEGTAVPASGDGSANFTVTLPDVASGSGTVQSSLYILATDYENYALAYSCSNLEGNKRSIGAWKLSRERTLTPEGNTAINAAMVPRPELVEQYFRGVEQDDDCPEPSSGILVRSSIMIVLVITFMHYLL